MKASPERSRAGGFTLLETMIALVIMALGAAVMYGSLRLAANGWTTRARWRTRARSAGDLASFHRGQRMRISHRVQNRADDEERGYAPQQINHPVSQHGTLSPCHLPRDSNYQPAKEKGVNEKWGNTGTK